MSQTNGLLIGAALNGAQSHRAAPRTPHELSMSRTLPGIAWRPQAPPRLSSAVSLLPERRSPLEPS